MKAFFYFDNSAAKWTNGKWISPVLFWTEKESILEADQEINKALNIKIEKMSHIGCQIFDLTSYKDMV